ncbi:uncharacterized protein BYT42DRAFT_605026 [Radiomyces spectabilis]|uniref:uncharacterized protein n=1 Tax=Radiomyces spectabilis TaxID=64574 RepID=UPI002220672C|nr:uncharacterized protein BYT42DRAFT_605026 [Radiomyces spectabilis]KAI8379719.1 hypothetical protein BYT42DRAFT_605026 [Radiomyces spectabilis]
MNRVGTSAQFFNCMPMGLTGKSQNEFYIDLHEHRFYFPGDVIKGDVVLDLAKPTKTNHIRITFSGDIQTSVATIQLFTKTMHLATSPDGDGKSHYLEAQNHRFPFEFKIPSDECELPSSMQLDKIVKVKYQLVALHDRPLILDQFAPKTEKSISILERLDASLPEYNIKGEMIEAIRLDGLDDPRKAQVSMILPKFAIVRGDILPIIIHLKHFHDFTRKRAVKLQLIRHVYAGKSKGECTQKAAIMSHYLDIDIPGPLQFSQQIQTKMLIPTSTPPTVAESGRIFSIEYSIRAIINLNEKTDDPELPEQSKNIIYMNAPIVIGTFPKPDVMIDDDDEEEIVQAPAEAEVLEEQLPEEMTDTVSTSYHEAEDELTQTLNNLAINETEQPSDHASLYPSLTDADAPLCPVVDSLSHAAPLPATEPTASNTPGYVKESMPIPAPVPSHSNRVNQNMNEQSLMRENSVSSNYSADTGPSQRYKPYNAQQEVNPTSSSPYINHARYDSLSRHSTVSSTASFGSSTPPSSFQSPSILTAPTKPMVMPDARHYVPPQERPFGPSETSSPALHPTYYPQTENLHFHQNRSSPSTSYHDVYQPPPQYPVKYSTANNISMPLPSMPVPSIPMQSMPIPSMPTPSISTPLMPSVSPNFHPPPAFPIPYSQNNNYPVNSDILYPSASSYTPAMPITTRSGFAYQPANDPVIPPYYS